MNGEDYEAAKPVPARTLVTGDPWVHLPECSASKPNALARGHVCVCPALRACEQRMEASNQGFADMASFELGKREERKRSAALIADAYAAGLAAARDAVAALPHDTYCVTRDENYQRPCNCPVDDALAAIDALKGEQA